LPASHSQQLGLFIPAAARHEDVPAPLQSAPVRLSEAAGTYCAHLVANERATHTVASTALDLAALVEQTGDISLSIITPTHLADHVRWLRTERHNGTASLRRKIATLKTFFRHAVAVGWLTTNPADSLAYPPPHRPPVVALNPTEVEAVIAAAAPDLAWHAVVLLFVDAGLKRDEVLALRTEDLYLAREPGESQLTVRHAAQAKRVRRRSVPLTPRAHFALARLLSAPLPGGPLLSISVRGVNFVVETVGHRAQITRLKKLTPDLLRDTFAVRAVEDRVGREAAAAERGATARELDRLRANHDLQVLQLLGLSRNSDMALRYRAAAAVRRSATMS
jgi:integrase